LKVNAFKNATTHIQTVSSNSGKNVLYSIPVLNHKNNLHMKYTLRLLTAFLSLSLSQYSFGQFLPSNPIETSFATVAVGEEMLNTFSYDFNKDGILDLALDGGMTYPQSAEFYPASNAIILIGNGDGTFTQSATSINYATGSINNLLAISDFADYNQDGNVDMLVYSFWNNGFYLYDGNNNGFLTFDAPTFFSCSTHGYEAIFIDYDADGDLDIVSACSGSNAPLLLHVFDNTNNSFTHNVYGDVNSTQYSLDLKHGDVNGDGRMDFFMPIDGGFTLATQNADKSFEMEFYQEGWNNPLGQLDEHKLLVDVNQDGYDDVIAYNRSFEKLDVFNSSGPPVLFDLSSNANNSSPEIRHIISDYFYGGFMYSHDMDLDSNTDIVFVQSNGSDLDSLVIAFDPFNINNSHQVQAIPLGADCSTETGRGMLFEDFDNNGLDDICFLGSDNKVRVILNMSPLIGINNFQTQLTEGLVYPNPNSGVFFIDPIIPLNTIEKVKVFNLSGQLIYESSTPKQHQINTEQMLNGAYIVVIKLDNSLLYAKIVIE
jgi:hypothetical protein